MESAKHRAIHPTCHPRRRVRETMCHPNPPSPSPHTAPETARNA